MPKVHKLSSTKEIACLWSVFVILFFLPFLYLRLFIFSQVDSTWLKSHSQTYTQNTQKERQIHRGAIEGGESGGSNWRKMFLDKNKEKKRKEKEGEGTVSYVGQQK